jgi:hypothetical protein
VAFLWLNDFWGMDFLLQKANLLSKKSRGLKKSSFVDKKINAFEF